MSTLKPVILFAMATALTACATSYNSAADQAEAKSDPNAAAITVAYNPYGSIEKNFGAVYQICERANCETTPSSPKFLPYRKKETSVTRVTADEPILVVASLPGLSRPLLGSLGNGSGPFSTAHGKRGKACVRELEFTPKASKSYRVTLVEKEAGDCSLEITET